MAIGALNTLILVCLVVVALFTVMTRSLLRAGLGLAVTSAILTIIIYRLNAPLAAVFELSVCAGLIPVIFITVISLTKPLTPEEAAAEQKEKFSRFWPLPIVIAVLAVVLYLLKIKFDVQVPPVEVEQSAAWVIWKTRQIDLIGQIAILLAGAFSILILFKETKKK